MGRRLVGWIAFPAAGVAAGAVLALETALAALLAGRTLEKLDPSDF